LNTSVIPPKVYLVRLMGWNDHSGFAVVFAEDVPDVPSQDIPTGKSLSDLCFP
jgi:hypothetical protein